MQASELSAAAITAKANQSTQSMNVDVDVLTSAYRPMQADVVASPALITQPIVEAEALPHTASFSGTATTESLCSMPSVSTYTNALFSELINLLPNVEVIQGLQVSQGPQLSATSALASGIPWPGQATKPMVGHTQPGPPPVVSATSANAVFQPRLTLRLWGTHCPDHSSLCQSESSVNSGFQSYSACSNRKAVPEA